MNMFSMLVTDFTFRADKQKGGETVQTQLLLSFMLPWMKGILMSATAFTPGTEQLSSWDRMQTSCSSRWHVHCPYRNTLHPNPTQTCCWEQSWLVSIKHSQYWNRKLMHCVLYFFLYIPEKKNIRKEGRCEPLSLQHNHVAVKNWEQELITSFFKTWQYIGKKNKNKNKRSMAMDWVFMARP